MLNQMSLVTSSLSTLDLLTEDSISQAMDLSGSISFTRILVSDYEGKILYDSSVTDSGIGRYALFAEIQRALNGNDVFYSTYDGTSFISRSAGPIMRNGSVVGAVYLYEYDTEQASIISGIQKNLLRISALICVVSIVIALLFSRLLTDKLTVILKAIQKVRSGEYGYNMAIHGKDEITQIGREFNDLSKRLQVTEEMRRRFVSDASHELKTPLASIKLLSDSIVQSNDMDAETIKEFVTDIGDEADRLTRTTEKLLALTRLDSKAVTSAATVIDVSTVANRVLHMLSVIAESKNITLRSSITDGCFVFISFDELYAIIFNLVENAIKYNTPNGEVHLMVYQYNDLVRIVVDDTGIGIPVEDINNIFDRFYRVDKARSREAGGSGLGLSIVKDTVTKNGGTIEVIRRERGTRFRVCFPQANDRGEMQQ